MNKWREAVIDELVTCCIYSKEHDTNPRKALQDLISWHIETERFFAEKNKNDGPIREGENTLSRF